MSKRKRPAPGTILCHYECMLNRPCPYPKGESPCDERAERVRRKQQKTEYEFHS